MNINDYQKFAGKAIRPESEGKDPLVGFALGLAGECGEVVDSIKKKVYHGRVEEATSKEHMVEELGDVMWYVANLATTLGVSLEEVLDKNYEKLENRYKKLYEKEN